GALARAVRRGRRRGDERAGAPPAPAALQPGAGVLLQQAAAGRRGEVAVCRQARLLAAPGALTHRHAATVRAWTRPPSARRTPSAFGKKRSSQGGLRTACRRSPASRPTHPAAARLRRASEDSHLEKGGHLS